MKQVGNVVEKNIAIAGFVGNTAVNAATVGSGAAVNYISSIDVEDAINKTEEAVINSKQILSDPVGGVNRHAFCIGRNRGRALVETPKFAGSPSCRSIEHHRDAAEKTPDHY